MVTAVQTEWAPGRDPGDRRFESARSPSDFGPSTQQEGTATLTVSYAVRSWFDSRCCDRAGAARVAERLFRTQGLESSTLSTGSIAGDLFVIGSACCAGWGSFGSVGCGFNSRHRCVRRV
jgi:hypothetical protein